MAEMITYVAEGTRVFVEYEGMGTVVRDEGVTKIGKRTLDAGVLVTLDHDGVTVSAGHAMIVLNPTDEQRSFRP